MDRTYVDKSLEDLTVNWKYIIFVLTFVYTLGNIQIWG